MARSETGSGGAASGAPAASLGLALRRCPPHERGRRGHGRRRPWRPGSRTGVGDRDPDREDPGYGGGNGGGVTVPPDETPTTLPEVESPPTTEPPPTTTPSRRRPPIAGDHHDGIRRPRRRHRPTTVATAPPTTTSPPATVLGTTATPTTAPATTVPPEDDDRPDRRGPGPHHHREPDDHGAPATDDLDRPGRRGCVRVDLAHRARLRQPGHRRGSGRRASPGPPCGRCWCSSTWP